MATTATKVRLNKGRCISGMDGVNVEYTILLDVQNVRRYCASLFDSIFSR